MRQGLLLLRLAVIGWTGMSAAWLSKEGIVYSGLFVVAMSVFAGAVGEPDRGYRRLGQPHLGEQASSIGRTIVLNS